LAFQYPQDLNLNGLNVYKELDLDTQDLFNVDGLPNILTFGKHYFTLSFNESETSNLSLKLSSQVLFEFKDSQNNLIFSEITNYQSVNGSAVCYIWVREQRSSGYYGEIANGIGTLTIVGELDNVPGRYKDAYNVRLTIPIEIRKDLPNISPILFQSSSLIQTKLLLSESIDSDTGDTNYKRSYINVSASHMQTYGGVVDKIELSYRETRAKNNEFKSLNIYQLSSSIYESNLTETGGLNPISDLQKFPAPRELRRNGEVEYRLRFLNANGEYAQDISQNNVDVTITGSISNFTGSAVILETADNLVTGSGAFIFGPDVNNGIRMDFKPSGTGNVKDASTIEFTKVVAGVDDKAIYALSDKGEIINDIETNKVTGSDNSSIIASKDSVISSSLFGSIMASSGSSMEYSPLSIMLGGTNNKIHNPSDNTATVANVIIGGGTNIMSSSFSTDKVINSIMLGGSTNTIQQIHSNKEINSAIVVGGLNNTINTGLFPMILGGNSNLISGSDTDGSIILGGAGNTVIHQNSIIIGKTSFISTADDTVFINNLDVDGTITANEFHTTYTSASIIYQSGSTQFGDTQDDTHKFSGSLYLNSGSNNTLIASSSGKVGIGTFNPPKTLTVEGSISASGDLILENNKAILFTNTLDQLERNGLAWTNANYLSYGDSSLTAHQFTTNGGVRLFITGSTGNVGIGTSTPSKKLTVEGDISASGLLYTSASHGDPSKLLLAWDSGSGQVYYTSSLAFGGGGGGGSGTVTSIVAGSGLNGGTITSAGTISVDSASIAPFFSSSMNSLTVAGDISASGDLVVGNLSTNYISASNGNLEISDQLRVSSIIATGSGATSIFYDNLEVNNLVANLTVKSSLDWATQGISFTDPSSGNDGIILRYGSANSNVQLREALLFQTNNATHITISGSNETHVGIGTSIVGTDIIPSTLTVAGDISSSGDVYVGSNTTIGTNDTSINRDLSLGRDLYVAGDISASGDLYIDDIQGSTTLADSVDGGDVYFEIRNVNTDNGTDKTTSLKFGHNSIGGAHSAGKIVGGKEGGYSVADANRDSFMSFYTTLNATDTEYMRIASDGKVGIGTTASTKTLTVAGDISGSGTVYINNTEVISGSGQVLSGPNNDDTMIALTPADFIISDYYSRGDQSTAKIADNGAGVTVPVTSANVYAMKMIPKGFTATHVYVYNSATVSNGITVYEGDITNSTTTQKGQDDTNTLIDITDVVATGTNYIVVKFNPAATSDEIRGGYISIVRS